MVKASVGVPMKASEGSSLRNGTSVNLSTASSSSGIKKSHKKKKVFEQRQPWLQEQYLQLPTTNFLRPTSNRDPQKVINARLARKHRIQLIRARRVRSSSSQAITTEDTIITPPPAAPTNAAPSQQNMETEDHTTTNHYPENSNAVTTQITRALRSKKQKSKRALNLRKTAVSTSGSRPVRYRRPVINKWDLVTCPACKAIVWNAEAVVQETEKSPRMFSICCQQGRVKLPPRREPPSPLNELLEKSSFKLLIRIANGLLAFTSMGGKIDNSVTNAPGPSTFRIHGQTHHRIGSLIPPDGSFPQYLQLYIVDTANEIANRKKSFTKGNEPVEIDDVLVAELIKMLDENNHLAKTFRHARDRILSGGTVEFTITLVNQKHRGRQYDLPSAEEIGGLLFGDLTSDSAGRDIVLEYKSSKLQRISDLHPLYMALQYPLLFPYGEFGYDERIPYQVSEHSKIKREYMTMREFYAYQIQTRPSEGMTIIKSGKLLHQYIVDTYTATEQERLRFIRLNQKKLPAELYTNACDALESGDTDASKLGTKVILPSSFTGSPRYMSEKYQDAMAICRWFGNPNLFITFTANPNWVELRDHLAVYGGGSSNDRPDLESRIFKLKLDELMSDFKKGSFFPKPAAIVYTVERKTKDGHNLTDLIFSSSVI